MGEFPNPYAETREKSQGELAQEYAALFQMVAFLVGIELTDREKAAVPIMVGAILRERKNIDFNKIFSLLEGFMPK